MSEQDALAQINGSRLYTVKEIAKLMDLDGSYISRLLRDNALHGRKIANVWICLGADLKQFIERRNL